ncbi:hypothetical protein [Methanolobus psychrotolerans]|uniref:hypothetical protein n=1 Tax=Methanolobus psychrotolerans TaxID=1874706 RepID=UPI000B916C2D|nr:hypothetical protein [Methanolobus psychrotolerans]
MNNAFNIKIDLVDMSPASSIFKYPQIPEKDKELLSWEIVGDVCISCDNIFLTQSKTSGQDSIANDYVWYFLTDFHKKIPDLLEGKCVKQIFFDNPDVLTLIPQEEAASIIFECKCKNHDSKKECKTSTEKIVSALLRATKKLEVDLLNLNSSLEKSDELEILREAYADSLNLLLKYGYSISDD